MNEEQLQFAISQYLDGTLPEAEKLQLEAHLQADAQARRLLEEYRRLDGMVAQGMPVPEMNWDSLSQQISSAIGEEQANPHRRVLPAIFTSRWTWGISAIAAAVLLAITLIPLIGRDAGQTPPQIAISGSPTPVLPLATTSAPEVTVYEVPQTGAPVVAVAIGPSDLARALESAPWRRSNEPDGSVAIAGAPLAMDDESIGLLQ